MEVAGAALRLARVRVFEGRADLAHDEQRVVHREREPLLLAAGEHGLQALALEELVRDVERGVDLADAEQLDDVGVLELGGELHLVHQALDRLRAGGERGPHAQDGDDLLEAGRAELGRAVFGAQPGGFDFFEQHELPEFLFPGHGGRPRSLCEPRGK